MEARPRNLNGNIMRTIFLRAMAIAAKLAFWAADLATKIWMAAGALERGGANQDRLAIASQALGLAKSLTGPQEAFLIPGPIKPGSAREVDNGVHQNEAMKWDIAPGSLVLDIGSGQYPFRLATHLADMHMSETVHRQSTRLVRDGRPMLCFDVCQPPFRDKTWDFVFLSHVIEHVERPWLALREISRIGKRGYIEAPAKMSDALFNFTKIEGLHKWHVLVAGDTLIMVEWLPGERRDMGTEYFYNCLHSAFQNEVQNYFLRNRDMFFCGLRWEGEINFIVIGADGSALAQNLPGPGGGKAGR